MWRRPAMSTPKTASDDKQQAALPEELLQRLTSFNPTGLPVISLYLDSRANDQGKRDFGPFVHKQLSSRARTYPAHARQRDSCEEAFVWVEAFLEKIARPCVEGLDSF